MQGLLTGLRKGLDRQLSALQRFLIIFNIGESITVLAGLAGSNLTIFVKIKRFYDSRTYVIISKF